MSAILDFIKNPFRRWMLGRDVKKLCKAVEAGALDGFLELLLNVMSLVFFLDKGFRKNIEDFPARYTFMSKDNQIAASVIFKDNRMRIRRDRITNTNVTIKFKDSEALKNFLFNENPDIIKAVLENEITYDGNLNYIGKFAYMAKHLQLKYAF